MNVFDPASPEPRPAGRPPTRLDDLLRAFFRSEMPDLWPSVQHPAAPAARAVPSRPLWRSRVALAAAVLLLLLGQWFVAGVRRDGMPVRPEPVLENGTAQKKQPRNERRPATPSKIETESKSDSESPQPPRR